MLKEADLMKDPYATRNQFAFSLGTIGRDMLYTLVSMYLTFYLTDVLNLPDSTFIGAGIIMLIIRIYDGFNDPFMGYIVDNTKGRFGKFKPWIAIGALTSAIFTILFFSDFGLTGPAFLVSFTVIYVFWEVAFTANDIAYWSMLPALSIDQKVREKIGASARICANIGLFAVVVGVMPITKALGASTGSLQKGFFLFAVIICVIMVLGQCITLFGVKEHKEIFKDEEHTTLRDMFRAIIRNDQLLYVALSMGLFMIGYTTTASFGIYFFKYAYKNEDMYPIFALILGISQIVALAVFPIFSKRFTRKQLYLAATFLIVAGYIIFFFSPMNMLFIGTAGVLLFVGEAFIQLLMLVFLTDTIEYGQWKLGRRNESVTFSVQPFINKIGGAVGNGIVSITVVIAGINAAKTPGDVTAEGLLIMKSAMLFLPLLFIVAGYLVYRAKFKIDKEMFDKIVVELKERGDILDRGIGAESENASVFSGRIVSSSVQAKPNRPFEDKKDDK